MKITKPTTCAEAIRCACYVNAYRVTDLAKAIGSADAYLSEVINNKKRGSFKLLDRILAQIKGVEWV